MSALKRETWQRTNNVQLFWINSTFQVHLQLRRNIFQK